MAAMPNKARTAHTAPAARAIRKIERRRVLRFTSASLCQYPSLDPPSHESPSPMKYASSVT